MVSEQTNWIEHPVRWAINGTIGFRIEAHKKIVFPVRWVVNGTISVIKIYCEITINPKSRIRKLLPEMMDSEAHHVLAWSIFNAISSRHKKGMHLMPK